MGDEIPDSPEENLTSRPPTREDLVALCGRLNELGGKYVVIGGFAVIHAGYARVTEYLDLLIDTTIENEALVYRALESLPDGAVRELGPGEVSQHIVVRVADEITVDLMRSACGIEYAEAAQHVVTRVVDGVAIPFASPLLLWRMKRHTHREKDIPDLIFLRRLLESEGITPPRMITPLLRDDAFLADIARPLEGELRVWWLGQSGFLVRCGGKSLLLDPYLSDSLTLKYAGTDKPHVRMTERVIAPGRLTGISIVTSSHNHTDHLDAETLKPLMRENPQMRFVIPEANRAFVANRLGISVSEPIGLDDGVSATVEGFEFHGIAAAHNAIDRDANGNCHYLGYIIRAGGWTLYHSGDTLLYPGLAEKLRPFAIDVAFLPINGNKPERRVAGNLDGCEAAQLAHDTGARWVVPCHYEMFEFNTASPEDFIAECKRLGQPHRILRGGEGWSVPTARLRSDSANVAPVKNAGTRTIS